MGENTLKDVYRATADELNLWGPIKPSVKKHWIRYYPNETPLYFVNLVRQNLRPEYVVLEVGAGAGKILQHQIRGLVKQLVGVDPDDRVLSNEQIDEGVVGTAECLALSDETFDVAFHHMVAEHLADPVTATREIVRVLKPGGRFFMYGPNKNHYTMLISRFTPMWFHETYMKLIGTRRDPSDVHIPYYRMNGKKDIEDICSRVGLEIERLEFKSMPPGYLRFSVPTFLLGTLWERVVEKHCKFLRSQVVLVARKPM